MSDSAYGYDLDELFDILDPSLDKPLQLEEGPLLSYQGLSSLDLSLGDTNPDIDPTLLSLIPFLDCNTISPPSEALSEETTSPPVPPTIENNIIFVGWHIDTGGNVIPLKMDTSNTDLSVCRYVLTGPKRTNICSRHLYWVICF